jgi:hypothetical protein
MRRASCLMADVAQSSRLACALLVSVLAACGGRSFDVDPNPNGGGSHQGGSGQGGSSAGSGRGGTSSKAGAPSGGSGQGGSAGAQCAGFEDAATGSYVQVAIINRTTAAIYLGQDMVNCGVSPLFQVGDASGVVLQPPNSCSGSCQTLIKQGPIGCPAICAFPSAVALQPGETLYTSWQGLFQVQRELPLQCVPSDYGVTTCQQTTQVQPGAFTFSAVAGRSLDCKATTGGACVACTPTPGGGCSTSGALIAGQMLNAVTNVQLDASFGVYGNPPPAPAPLPLPNDPGGSSGNAMALRTVELVFTE